MTPSEIHLSTNRLDFSQPVGLALGGGAARGWAHVGVIRALEEAGLRVCAVAGTSIGAMVGAFYAAGRLEALAELGGALSRMGVARLMDPTVGRAGLFSGEKVCGLLREQLPGREIESLPLPFAAAAVNLSSGEEVIFRTGDLVAAIRASISIPGVFAPMHHEGQLLVDGGLVDPLPVGIVRSLGAKQVVAVDLNFADERIPRPLDVEDDDDAAENPGAYPQQPGNDVSPLEQGLNRLRKQWRRTRQSPGMFDVLASTMVIIERSLTNARLTWDAPDLLIRPEAGACRLIDFHRADEMIAQGYDAAKTALSTIPNP